MQEKKGAKAITSGGRGISGWPCTAAVLAQPCHRHIDGPALQATGGQRLVQLQQSGLQRLAAPTALAAQPKSAVAVRAFEMRSGIGLPACARHGPAVAGPARSEEHTSEL